MRKTRVMVMLTAAMVTIGVLSRFVLAQEEASPTGGQEDFKPADQMVFTEVMPGISKAVLWGDPDQGAYGALTKFKAGTRNPRHSHSSDIKIVVISGAYLYETGDGQKKIGPGSYILIPGGRQHVSGAEEDTLFLEQSSGKFDLNVVE